MNPNNATKVAQLRIDAINKAILYIEVAYRLYNCVYINHAHESMVLAKKEIEIILKRYIEVAGEKQP